MIAYRKSYAIINRGKSIQFGQLMARVSEELGFIVRVKLRNGYIILLVCLVHLLPLYHSGVGVRFIIYWP